MTSKERLQTALEHREPDRVPYMATFVPEMELALKERHRGELTRIQDDVEMRYQGMNPMDILFDHDMLLLTYGLSTGYYRDTPADTYVDEWGITWRKIPYLSPKGPGHYTEIVQFPLADEAKVAGYRAPDPNHEDMGYAETVIARFGGEKYICGIIDCSIFEALKYLRGITQSLIDVVANKELAHHVMDLSVEYHLELGRRLIDRGVDMLWLADDIGGEHAMLMSPETFREMVKPKMGTMIAELKGRNPRVKVAFHSDGYIEPVIDDLVEVGVDLLNPIQPESMDPARIKRRYGERIALWGTVSVQDTLPFKSAREVEAEVRERIASCAPGGGFLIAPTHNIQLDVPFENIDAFYGGVRRYGSYPIRA
jgi:uroporphyrinogen decarboxylase